MGSPYQPSPGQPVFDDAEAHTFASTWAGFDMANANEAEAMTKGRMLRRKAAEKNLRVIDALELPEIRRAIDEQLSPKRGPCQACPVVESKLQDAETKLTERERQTKILIDDYKAQIKEKDDQLKQKTRTARQQKQAEKHPGIVEFLGLAWSYSEWRIALLLALILGSPWLMAQDYARAHSWSPYVLEGLGVLLLLWWAAAEIDQTGWAQLLIKFALLLGGCAALRTSEFEFAWPILGLVALLTATRLINNLCELAMRVPHIAAVVAFFQ